MATGDHLDAQVRDIMTPGVLTISEDASLRQAERALIVHKVHALVVVGRHHARPLGWLTARGLLSWIERDASVACARDAITERPEQIEPSASAHEALIAISQPGVSHLLVCRVQGGAPEGVISELDLVALGTG